MTITVKNNSEALSLFSRCSGLILSDRFLKKRTNPASTFNTFNPHPFHTSACTFRWRSRQCVCVCVFASFQHKTPSGDFPFFFFFFFSLSLFFLSLVAADECFVVPVTEHCSAFCLTFVNSVWWRLSSPDLWPQWPPTLSLVGMSIKTPAACYFSSSSNCGIAVCGQQPAETPQEVDLEYSVLLAALSFCRTANVVMRSSDLILSQNVFLLF